MNFKQKTKLLINDEKKWQEITNYVALIEKENNNINLTRFKDDKLWEEAIYQSLKCLSDIIPNQEVKLLDVGAGAGFPSIPLKIVSPKINLTIYEPINKKVFFLKNISDELNLKINVLKKRAEESDENETFDYITARAVAPLKILIEITHHLGKIGAHFIFIKGLNFEKEINQAQKIIKLLNLTIKVQKIKVKDKVTNLIIYTKNSKTPQQFPRSWKKIINHEKM